MASSTKSKNSSSSSSPRHSPADVTEFIEKITGASHVYRRLDISAYPSLIDNIPKIMGKGGRNLKSIKEEHKVDGIVYHDESKAFYVFCWFNEKVGFTAAENEKTERNREKKAAKVSAAYLKLKNLATSVVPDEEFEYEDIPEKIINNMGQFFGKGGEAIKEIVLKSGIKKIFFDKKTNTLKLYKSGLDTEDTSASKAEELIRLRIEYLMKLSQ